MQITFWKRVDLWPHECQVWRCSQTFHRLSQSGRSGRSLSRLEQETQQHQKKPQKCCLFAFSVFISVHLLPGFSLTWLCPSPPSTSSSSSSSGHGGDLRGSGTLCDQTNQDASEPPRATRGRTSELVLEQRSRPSSPLLPLLLALSIVTPFSAAAAFAVRVWRLWRAGPTPDRQTS